MGRCLQLNCVCILSKTLKESVINRAGYISNHVISILLEGEQQIRTYEDEVIRVKANEVLFIPRGMYSVSDLIPKDGSFRSLLFYFDRRGFDSSRSYNLDASMRPCGAYKISSFPMDMLQR